MNDGQNEHQAPPRFRNNLIKIMTLTLLFLALFFIIGFSGLKATSSSKFCSSCHEMTPEYYTWKASTHSEVDCINCHIEPGAKNLVKDKANGLIQIFDNVTNQYTAPIQMPKEIPNPACERCHNMKTRDVTSSGDLVIPHEKHLNKGIQCVDCHSGVAHGRIAERNVTFKTDYSKWDDALGQEMMRDVTFTSPKMQDCIDCHKIRDVSTACKTCHSTGMKPKSHKEADFKTSSHGKLAEKDIKLCNSCHQYTSDTDIQGLQPPSPTEQFLSGGKVHQQSITAQDYTKENSFCKKCHQQRPQSHVKGWSNIHGPIAKNDTRKCLTCHDYLKTGFNKTTNITCSGCHPAMHAGKNYKEHHPIDLTGVTQPQSLCYTCHNKQICTSCHKD